MRRKCPALSRIQVVPRLRTTSVVLWLIYSGFTLLETIILRCAGMSWYEGTIHAMGTLATGGFSTRNISVEAFHSLPIELILIVFMFLAGLNFSLYYRILKKRSLKPLWQSTEVRVFCGVILVASILVTIALAGSYGLPLGEAYCRALFSGCFGHYNHRVFQRQFRSVAGFGPRCAFGLDVLRRVYRFNSGRDQNWTACGPLPGIFADK